MQDFLRNCWYIAAEASEVTSIPIGRTVVEKPIVMFRTENGTAVALEDRCPHRFIRLSLGKVCGSEVQCIYHGLRFNAAGECVHNPHGPIAATARIESYPMAERYGYCWIWLGDPERARTGQIPELPELEPTDDLAIVRGYLTLKANYQLVVDNLLDLSHVEFLHPMFMQADGVEAHQTSVGGDSGHVFCNRKKLDTSVTGFWRMLWSQAPDRGDTRANMSWYPPSLLRFDLGYTKTGGSPEEGISAPAIHFITPETETTSHYFWVQARNRNVEDADLSERLYAVVNQIFETEDKMVLEEQQRQLGQETDILKMRPLVLKPDDAGLRARRLMKRLISKENKSKRLGPALARRQESAPPVSIDEIRTGASARHR